MTRRRQSRRKHTRERRQTRENPRKTATSREIPRSPERLRECTPIVFELAPLAGAILCILAIGILAAATPPPPREISAFAQLERKIARQALAVELAAERFRRGLTCPLVE